ncbi:MAG: Crp/Fnr family transcriptional regulator [Clostridia bacterium]|nr:Crp/Fnr family transcriptional regulator [Clostridia bacterium]
MKKYLGILKKTKLFAGVGEDEIESMLTCLGARLRHYPKGAFVFRAGEHLHSITLLVKGSLHIQRDDYWGNRSIVQQVGVGEMFGEAYASPDSGVLLNDVVALEESEALHFDVQRILSVCPSACPFHALTVKNLFYALSEKNRALVAKLGYMASRTTREKLLAYLSDQAKKQGTSAFAIPFNRQQLADFLSVDRSAMSSELCKMRDEGILRFEKNRFVLLTKTE